MNKYVYGGIMAGLVGWLAYMWKGEFDLQKNGMTNKIKKHHEEEANKVREFLAKELSDDPPMVYHFEEHGPLHLYEACYNNGWHYEVSVTDDGKTFSLLKSWFVEQSESTEVPDWMMYG